VLQLDSCKSRIYLFIIGWLSPELDAAGLAGLKQPASSKHRDSVHITTAVAGRSGALKLQRLRWVAGGFPWAVSRGDGVGLAPSCLRRITSTKKRAA
jgi:hypothetical protein